MQIRQKDRRDTVVVPHVLFEKERRSGTIEARMLHGYTIAGPSTWTAR
jgi:hypothetical protein